MWYHYPMRILRSRREKKIDRYTRRMDELTEAIGGIMEPWSDVVAELENKRAALFFRRQKLLLKQSEAT